MGAFRTSAVYRVVVEWRQWAEGVPLRPACAVVGVLRRLRPEVSDEAPHSADYGDCGTCGRPRRYAILSLVWPFCEGRTMSGTALDHSSIDAILADFDRSRNGVFRFECSRTPATVGWLGKWCW